MRKKISFVIVTDSGTSAKQFSTTRLAIGLIGILLLAGLGVVSYIVHDYCRLRQTNARLEKREKFIGIQMSEIQHQRRQIQEFAKEINSLKSKLMALNGFEKKIRIIANIEKKNDSGNLFGIGGSVPEDLDPRLPLKEKHNSLMREMHEQIRQLSDASINQQHEFESLLKSLEDQQNLLASTPTIRPVSRNVTSWITSRFGYRKSPFTGRREFHRGFDISARRGTPILATADGVVTYVGKMGMLGLSVVIDHGHGIVTRYGHCMKVLKKKGERVKRWEPIALMGNTGRSTGPHVHYEVRLNGIPDNPEKYILN